MVQNSMKKALHKLRREGKLDASKKNIKQIGFQVNGGGTAPGAFIPEGAFGVNHGPYIGIYRMV